MNPDLGNGIPAKKLSHINQYTNSVSYFKS